MYGKIHGSFFDSSIVETDIETRFVFVAMIVLSDEDGKLDITRQALARRINVDMRTVEHALEVLSSPDEMSRTPDHDGRRIVPLDPERSWGWLIVNKATYRHTSPDEKRKQNRERKRRQRDRSRDGHVLPASTSTESDTDTDTDVTLGHAESRSGHALSRKERDARFDATWAKVPRKEGKTRARETWEANVRTADDADRFDRGVDGYLRKVRAERTRPMYMLYGSTLFSRIDDHIDWQPPEPNEPRRPDGIGGLAL